MKDWAIRAIKTFVQAFFGVLIPAICTMLNDGWPESWGKIWIILAPTVAAALAAAICAVWNIIREELEKAPLMVDPAQDAKDKAELDQAKENQKNYGWDGKL